MVLKSWPDTETERSRPEDYEQNRYLQFTTQIEGSQEHDLRRHAIGAGDTIGLKA